MGFSFIGWLQDRLGNKPVTTCISGDLVDEYAFLMGDIFVREMAFWSAVNLISGAIGKCEFKTYRRGQEIKGREHYLWNLAPNKNQDAGSFIRKWLAMLYRNNECLIIEENDQLLVADSFTRKQYALYDDVFTQVTVGDYTFSRSFVQNEVFYFTLNAQDMRRLMAGLYQSYSKLVAYSMKHYQRSRGTKGVYQYDTLPVAGTKDREIFDKLLNEDIKKWLESDNAALPLGRGQSWAGLDKKNYSPETSRDIRALLDDISDFTAKAFCIPPVLLRGDVQDTATATEQFLTFCLDPLASMLQKEINRKRASPAQYAAGTYLQIDTRKVKHIDLLSVAAPIDKLISSGFFTVNNMLELAGMPRISEAWADAHFITKNYAPIEEVLKNLSAKGGETD